MDGLQTNNACSEIIYKDRNQIEMDGLQTDNAMELNNR